MNKLKQVTKFNCNWFVKRHLYLQQHDDVGILLWIKLLMHDAFNWKCMLSKIVIFLITCCFLIPISLHLQHWALSMSEQETILASNAIISVQPIGNPGIEFSFLANQQAWVVFFVESITIIVASICLIFCPNNWLYMVSISFVLIGGIMNTNCRASVHEYYDGSYYQLQHFLNPNDPQYGIKNVVIDYWHFNTDRTQYCIFNFNDCCVISGAIGYGLFLFINLLINYAPYLFKQTKKVSNHKLNQWKNK